MFYVKNENGDKAQIEEVFCTCPRCGAEVQIDDFQALLQDDNVDLYGSSLYCDCCAVSNAKEHPGEPWAQQVLAEHGESAGTSEREEIPRITERDQLIYEDGHNAGVIYAQERMKEFIRTL